MIARRDLVAHEERGSARRTHGGAVLPSIAAFASPAPGETIFLDSSSTAYFLARRIADIEAAVKRAMLDQADGATRLRADGVTVRVV